MADTFVQTSVARRLIARMQVTHERARISVFSGPPGIGKTTAIDMWRRRHPDHVAVVKIDRRNAGEAISLQNCLYAFRDLARSKQTHMPRARWELRRQIFNNLCTISQLDPLRVRMTGIQGALPKPVTVVFDEAQNLSRAAIDVLRYWSDADRCYAPHPIGLVFVGNNEFALASTKGEDSVISAAIADRALYIQSFDYDELTDSDLAMVIEARGVSDPAAAFALMNAFGGPRAVRSLRRISDLIDELREEAGSSAITADLVRQVLSLS